MSGPLPPAWSLALTEPLDSMGILFGGVSDDDKDEETLDSTFYNEL